MANVAYALLVQEIASGIDRERLDDALAGRVTIRKEDEVGPMATTPDNVGPIIPNASSIEELRENWGRDPSAIRAKLMFDQTIGSLPPMPKKK